MKKWACLLLLCAGCREMEEKSNKARLHVLDNTIRWADSTRRANLGEPDKVFYYDSLLSQKKKERDLVLRSIQSSQ